MKKADCKINEELVNALLQIDFSSYFHSTRVEKLAPNWQRVKAEQRRVIAAGHGSTAPRYR